MHTTTEQKECWTVTLNRDRTEGRGPLYVAHVCWNESTAIRLAKNKCVQGSDGKVTKAWARKFEGDARWYVPSYIEDMSNADNLAERAIEEVRRKVAKKEAALQRAKELGLSDDDLAIIRDIQEPKK